MSKCIEIEGCGKCPYVGFFDSSQYSAECVISCLHPEANDEGTKLTVKIRNVNGNIYFNCPLPKFPQMDQGC